MFDLELDRGIAIAVSPIKPMIICIISTIVMINII